MSLKKISLDKDNPTVADLLKAAEEWENKPVSELSDDQLAILDLKKAIGGTTGTTYSNECFICVTGA